MGGGADGKMLVGRIFRTPAPLDLAMGQVEAWMESPTLAVLSEHDQYPESLRDVVLPARNPLVG